MNVFNIVIDLVTFAYILTAMIQIGEIYRNDPYNEKLTTLNTQLGYYIGAMLLTCSVFIIASYFLMRKTFTESENLKASQFKQSIQTGFLIIAIAYVLRSGYSLGFQYFAKIVEEKFNRLWLQTLINLVLDLPVVGVVLLINRKTIHLRQLLNDEEQKKKDQETHIHRQAA